MWPSFGTAAARAFNRSLLRRQLVPILSSLPRPPIGVTTVPVVADLIGALPIARWIYYCVDDLSEWPGLDGRVIAAMERELVRRADVIVAVSETLRGRLAGQGRDSHLLTHGLDLESWSSPEDEPVPELDALERPLVIFWGSIDGRLDASFLDRLGRDLQQGTIVLIGPWSDPPAAVARVPRLVRVNPLPYRRLPAVGRRAGVLVMPYADLPVTRAMQPLKLKEYLATGKAVVARDLPATREWGDCLDLADSAQSFSEAVRRCLEVGINDEQQRARMRLKTEDWSNKTRQFEGWLAS
jgi:glycosyltransferase involved in cell wall biosynthesis